MQLDHILSVNMVIVCVLDHILIDRKNSTFLLGGGTLSPLGIVPFGVEFITCNRQHLWLNYGNVRFSRLLGTMGESTRVRTSGRGFESHLSPFFNVCPSLPVSTFFEHAKHQWSVNLYIDIKYGGHRINNAFFSEVWPNFNISLWKIRKFSYFSF